MAEPLTDTHYRDINKALNMIARDKALLDRCESAGLPCEEIRAELQVHEERLSRLKREFFPEKR